MNASRFPSARTCAFLALGLALLAPAAAQAAPRAADKPSRPLLSRLELEPAQLDKIEAVLAKDEQAVAKARAEIKVIQAKLSRLLLEKEVPMDQAKALVKESLDWEYQVRMIQIGRQAELRKILGDERWTLLFQLGRAARGKDGKADLGKLDKAQRERLLAILRRLN